MKITDIPTSYNQIYLVYSTPNADNSGAFLFPSGPAGTNLVTAGDIAIVRARGQRCVMVIGEYGASFAFTTRPQSQAFVDSFALIYQQCGALDGIEWNIFKDGLVSTPAEITWICGQLRTQYGSNFSISVASHPNITGAGAGTVTVIDAINAGGYLTYAAPQYYDATDWASTSTVTTHSTPWISRYGAAKFLMGLGANYKVGTEALSVANNQSTYAALKTGNPTMRGVTGYLASSDEAAGWTFGTDMKTTVNPAPVPPSVPVANFNFTPASVGTGSAVQFTNTSTGNPVPTLQWDIDNNGSVEYTSQNPSHVFNTAGSIQVKLTATNSQGSSNVTKTVTVTATAPPPPVGSVLPIPNKIVSGFLVLWRSASEVNTVLTSVPAPTYNQVYAFHTEFNSDGSIRPVYEANLTPAMVAAARARNIRVVYTVGGALAGFNFQSRTQSQNFVNSFSAMLTRYRTANANAVIDGCCFNNFEAFVGSSPSEMTWIGQQLKGLYGSNFSIDCTPHPNPNYAPNDFAIVQAMVAGGAMDFVSPQYYEGPGTTNASFVSSTVGQWNGVWASGAHVILGVTSGSTFGGTESWTTNAQAVALYNANPTKIKGAFGWTLDDDRAQNWSWGIAMRNAMGS